MGTQLGLDIKIFCSILYADKIKLQENLEWIKIGLGSRDAQLKEHYLSAHK